MDRGASINHIKITVSDFECSKQFYDKIFRKLGLRKMFGADKNSAWGGKVIGYRARVYERITYGVNLLDRLSI